MDIDKVAAQAAIEALGLAQEWGAISDQESEPYLVFDFRETAEKISAWRNEHGTPAQVVSRLVSPWTEVTDGPTQTV